MCSFQPLPVQWQDGFTSSPFPHRPGPRFSSMGDGRVKEAAKGVPRRCAPSLSASGFTRPSLASGVRSSVPPTSPPREPPRGPCSGLGPGSALSGPAFLAPLIQSWTKLVLIAGRMVWKRGALLMPPDLTVKHRLWVSWKHRLVVPGVRFGLRWRCGAEFKAKITPEKVVELFVLFKEKSWGGGFAVCFFVCLFLVRGEENKWIDPSGFFLDLKIFQYSKWKISTE